MGAFLDPWVVLAFWIVAAPLLGGIAAVVGWVAAHAMQRRATVLWLDAILGPTGYVVTHVTLAFIKADNPSFDLGLVAFFGAPVIHQAIVAYRRENT